MNPNSKNRIINYYQSLESFLGYKFLTWETKHFGFYPKNKKNLSEREAQCLMMDGVAKSLHPKETLKEFYRILKPGGKLALFEYTIAPKSDFTTHDWTILRSWIEDTAAFGLYNFLHDFFPRYLSTIGFTYVKERNITQNFLPSLERLKRIASIPYFFIEAFHLQKYFVNTTIAVEWYHLVKKDLLRYCIFTAEK